MESHSHVSVKHKTQEVEKSLFLLSSTLSSSILLQSERTLERNIPGSAVRNPRRRRRTSAPEGPAGACCRLKGLCRGWDRPERRTEEQSGRIVAMGPLPQVHPSDVRTWVQEHELEEGPADAWPMDYRASALDEGQRSGSNRSGSLSSAGTSLPESW
uniref:SCAN box domain-containing protein n=1 Tax=Oryzias latipes TaxID=8090 RepID=A0A3B3HY65_ORYLA